MPLIPPTLRRLASAAGNPLANTISGCAANDQVDDTGGHCSVPPLPSRLVSKYSSRPFGDDALRVAAVTAMAIIDRLGIVAKADDCAIANRTGLNRRHPSALPPASLRAYASACASVAKALSVPITA